MEKSQALLLFQQLLFICTQDSLPNNKALSAALNSSIVYKHSCKKFKI